MLGHLRQIFWDKKGIFDKLKKWNFWQNEIFDRLKKWNFWQFENVEFLTNWKNEILEQKLFWDKNNFFGKLTKNYFELKMGFLILGQIETFLNILEQKIVLGHLRQNWLLVHEIFWGINYRNFWGIVGQSWDTWDISGFSGFFLIFVPKLQEGKCS